MNKASSKGLYVHIPFCNHICAYCDFPKFLLTVGKVQAYLTSLFQELEDKDITDIDTIFIGGGTPSSLECDDLEYLLKNLTMRFPNLKEFTLEANPESLTLDKIKLCAKYGVNRVSLGVESSNSRLLKLLGRKHTLEDVIVTTDNLRKVGITNINLDFIYGVPGETISDLDNDLAFVKKINPTHLSFYPLQVEEGTLFYLKHYKEMEGSKLAKAYNHIIKSLKTLGYERYEVSNFAKPGYESKHNLKYWHNDEYYALGLGATQYVNGNRVVNTKNYTKYLKGEYVSESNYEDNEEREFNYLMLNLRLTEGFLLSDFMKRYKKDFLLEYKRELETVKPYLTITKTRVKVKKRYLYVLDSILVDLLHFKKENS